MLAKTPADLFGESPLLSRLDMKDEENVKDAAHQLDRCQDDFQLAAWVRRWGAPLIARLQEVGHLDSDDFVTSEYVKETEKELESVETRVGELEGAIKTAIGALEDASEKLGSEYESIIFAIADKLEAALDD